MQIWAITGGRRGNDVLVEGVAEALGSESRLIHAQLNRPYTWLAPYRPAVWGVAQDRQIVPPWPDLVLASGRQAVPHARYIRRVANGKTFVAFLQDPKINAKNFDFVWAPCHDQVRDQSVMQTILSPHGLTAEIIGEAAAQWRDRLVPSAAAQARRKIVTVTIGGPSQAYRFDAATMTHLAQKLATLTQQGCFLLITLSRRSPEAYGAILRQHIGPQDGFIWDNQGDNPYRAMLGLADHFIVTADSANMVGEACLAGKPVQVFALPGGSAKFDRFHASLQQHDFVRPFTGALQDWPCTPQNATPDIAAAIAAAMQKKAKTSE